MSHHQHVLPVAHLMHQLQKISVDRRRSELAGMHNLRLVSGFRRYQLCGLESAFERAGDDQVEVYLQCIQHMRELKAMLLAFLVERPSDIEERIGAPNSGAGVAKDI